MQYMLTPYASAQEPFAWWEGAFNEQQLNWLQQQARNWQQKAAIGGGGAGVTDPNIRRSGLNWMPTTMKRNGSLRHLGMLFLV